MIIRLTRFFGNALVTKSAMVVMSDEGRVLMECEAREPRYADYEEAFAGSASCCLARGRWKCKVMSTPLSPMTLTIVKSPGHRSCRIGWDFERQVKQNMILVGESDGEDDVEWREICRQEATFKKLERLVYEAFAMGEDIWLVITNPPSPDFSCPGDASLGEE